MSLINDALKQASRSQKVSLAGASAGGSSVAAGGLRPADDSAPRRKASSLILPTVLVLLLAASGWFIFQWWQMRGSGKPFNVGAQLAGMVNSVKALAGKKSGDDATANTATDSSTGDAPTATDPKSGNAITRLFNKNSGVTASPTGFPKLKLQGVYYRAGDSTALINGKNVSEGDEIEGVFVAKIDRQSVELQYQGETRVLRIH